MSGSAAGVLGTLALPLILTAGAAGWLILGSVIATAATTLAMLALRSGTLPAGHKQALVAGAEA